PLRTFEVTLELEHADPKLRPGTSVDLLLPGQHLENVLLLPRQAVFEKEGKPIVYERVGTGFQARSIKVVNRTESHVVVEDVAQGTEVALVSPESFGKTNTTKPASPGPGLAK